MINYTMVHGCVNGDVFMPVFVCVCVYVRERERERERDNMCVSGRERKR